MLGQDSLANGRGRDLIKSPTKHNTSKHFKMSNGSDKKKDLVVNSYFIASSHRIVFLVI